IGGDEPPQTRVAAWNSARKSHRRVEGSRFFPGFALGQGFREHLAPQESGIEEAAEIAITVDRSFGLENCISSGHLALSNQHLAPPGNLCSLELEFLTLFFLVFHK